MPNISNNQHLPHSDGGTYSNASSVNCHQCGAGRGSGSRASARPLCESGKRSGDRASTCTACGAGTFSSEKGSTTCKVRHVSVNSTPTFTVEVNFRRRVGPHRSHISLELLYTSFVSMISSVPQVLTLAPASAKRKRA